MVDMSTNPGGIGIKIVDSEGDLVVISQVAGKLQVQVPDGIASAARVESNPVLITKAVAVPGTAEPLVAVSTLVTQLVIEARKVGGVNTGIVYLGTSAVDKASSQQITLDPGDNYEFIAAEGQSLDLDSLYIDADTAADGITGWYIGA